METNQKTNQSYTLWSYDVWGNETDGFDVNDRSAYSRDVSMPDQPTDKHILLALKRCGYLLNSVKLSDLDISGDDICIYIDDAKNGRPLCGFKRNY